MILVRVYGLKTDTIVDREAEIRNMKLLHSAGCGPALLARFANGIAYEFVPGRIPTVEQIADPAFNQLVVEMFARVHRLDVGEAGSRRPCLWDMMRKFLGAMPEGVFRPPHDGDESNSPKARFLRECGLNSRSALENEIRQMERELSDCDSPVVQCHNDLLLGNIIHDPERKTVTFIDHEYGAPNYQAFDLGDHFTEFAGIDDETLDYARYYPKEEVQLDWLRRYLRAYNGGGEEPTEGAVRHLYVLTNKFALCANLKWGIWSLVQAANSSIDFDYYGYSRQRLNEYLRRKPQFLALK